MGKHKSQAQEKVFIDFMEVHPDLAKNFVKGDSVAAEALWADLTKSLNSQGPPQKDVNGWKKVWSDWKTCIRRKMAHNKCESRAGGGGGQYNKFVLTAAEDTIAQICGIYTSVEGIPGSSAFGDSQNEAVASDSSNDAIAEPDNPGCSVEAPRTTPGKRTRANDIQESIKKHMATEVGAVENISGTMKELLETSKETTKVLAESNGGLRRVYKSLEKMTELMAQQNELIAEQNKDCRKHYLAKQESLLIKNEIKKKMLDIEEIRLRREEQ